MTEHGNQWALVDLHSHILPGVDDGSRSVAESLVMLRMAADQGVRHMVATPHFYAHYDDPAAFLKRRTAAHRQLLEAMAAEGDLPSISLGAEVYFFHGISECDDISALTIADTNYMLVEMPPAPWTEAMYRELEVISQRRHITPIVAHVDRYIAPFRTYHIPDRLAELPVLVQANGDFFRAHPGMAVKMLRKGQIHLLGSDCHRQDTRVPDLGTTAQTIHRRLGQEALDWIAEYQREIFGSSY